MLGKIEEWKSIDRLLWFGPFENIRPTSKGQALVEFTLIFLLLLVVAWIPADFGLAFYTGQLAQNASREGARIAAADTTLPTQTGGGTVTCTLPCSGQLAGSILAETAERLSSALLPGATVSVTYPVAGGGCNSQVRVGVVGTYNFFFYHLLNALGASITPTANINYQTDMRWEHQIGCAP
jgi:Flp pilus assembly protein TadG